MLARSRHGRCALFKLGKKGVKIGIIAEKIIIGTGADLLDEAQAIGVGKIFEKLHTWEVGEKGRLIRGGS